MQPSSPAHSPLAEAARWLRVRLWWLLFALPLSLFAVAGGQTVADGGNLGWDSNWYASIATEGYRFDGDYGEQQNLAFFPLMPLLVALVRAVVNLPMGHAQIAVAAALTWATCWFMHATLRHLHGEAVATMAVGLFVAHPFALYLFNGYSEPAMVAPVAAMFYFLYVKPRPGWATVAVILASLARPYGVFVAAFLAAHMLQQWRWGKNPEWTRAVLLYLPLSVSGYLGFALYCGIRFGDPLASLHATAAWAGPFKHYDWQGVVALEAPIRAFFSGVAAQNLLDPVMVGVTVFGGGAAAMLACARQFPLAIRGFGLVLPLLLYVSQLSQRTGVNNAGRYSAVFFVHAAAVALLLRSLDRNLGSAVSAEPAAETQPLPPAFFVLYGLGLAALVRYTGYFFNGIWVS